MKTTLLFAALTALVAAQADLDLPACSVSCLTKAVGDLGCDLTDLTCSCGKASELVPIVTPCVVSACTDPADQARAAEVLSGLCADAGYPIEETPAQPEYSDAYEVASSTPPAVAYPTPTEEPEYPAYPEYSTTIATESEHPTPSHLTDDVPNLPTSYSELEPVPSYVDTIIVPRPSPKPTSVPGVLPPYPTDSLVSSVQIPSGTGAPSVTSSELPEFTGGVAAVRVPVVAAGIVGLAVFVL